MYLTTHQQKNVVPPQSASSPKNDSTNDCGADMLALNQRSTVSNLISTNHVDTDVNYDDDSQSFATPIKQNHSSTEIYDTNTTTT